jgi:hypothetical protein
VSERSRIVTAYVRLRFLTCFYTKVILQGTTNESLTYTIFIHELWTKWKADLLHIHSTLHYRIKKWCLVECAIVFITNSVAFYWDENSASHYSLVTHVPWVVVPSHHRTLYSRSILEWMAVPEEWEGLVTKDVQLQTSTKKCNVPCICEVPGPLYLININRKLKSCKVFEIDCQHFSVLSVRKLIVRQKTVIFL